MDVEVQLVEEVEKKIMDFESKLNTDVVMDTLIDNGFKKILEAINEFSSKLNEIAKFELDHFDQDKQPETDNIKEEERFDFLSQKEVVLNTVGNIKEALQNEATKK
jgi:hypothetical protein